MCSVTLPCQVRRSSEGHTSLCNLGFLSATPCHQWAVFHHHEGAGGGVGEESPLLDRAGEVKAGLAFQ